MNMSNVYFVFICGLCSQLMPQCAERVQAKGRGKYLRKG